MKIVGLLLILASCIPTPEKSQPTISSLYVTAGDLLVASTITDRIYQFDSNGNYKGIIYTLSNVADTIGGIGWMHTTNEILVTIDGTPDRTIAISASTGAVRDFIIDATNITGTMRGVTQLDVSRDIIISDGTGLERVSDLGFRETYTGAWPSTAHTNSQQVVALPNGGFLSCSSTATVRTYPDSITSGFTHTATVSNPASTTGSYGCFPLSDGKIAVSWYGASTDYLSIYSSALVLESHIINNNQGILPEPRGVSEARNGNIYVADNTRDYVIEVDRSGNVKKMIGLGILDSPFAIFTVPDFTP